MQFFAVVHGTSRGDEWRRKVAIDFDDGEDIKVIAATLLYAGYFNKQDAVEQLNEYHESKDTDSIFFYTHTTEEGKFCDNAFFYDEEKKGGYLVMEEGNTGFGITKEIAEHFFIKSEELLYGENDVNWEE
jgi:hypothetical protein